MGSINVNNSNKSGDFCGFKLPTSCVFTPGLKWWMIWCKRDVRVCDIAHHVFLAGEYKYKLQILKYKILFFVCDIVYNVFSCRGIQIQIFKYKYNFCVWYSSSCFSCRGSRVRGKKKQCPLYRHCQVTKDLLYFSSMFSHIHIAHSFGIYCLMLLIAILSVTHPHIAYGLLLIAQYTFLSQIRTRNKEPTSNFMQKIPYI